MVSRSHVSRSTGEVRSAGEQGPGWSIWIFVAIFVALSFVGLGAVVLIGNPTDDSRTTRTQFTDSIDSDANGRTGQQPTSEPASTDPIATDPTATDSSPTGLTPSGSEGSGAAGAESTASTLPGGSAAPADVTRVVVTDEALSLGFRADDKLTGTTPIAVVPPLRAAANGDGSALDISIGCSRTTTEQLAQLSVTETASAVTVSAVVLVPADALGCNPSARPRVITMPLQSPLAGRSVVVVPTSTKLPPVDLGSSSGE